VWNGTELQCHYSIDGDFCATVLYYCMHYSSLVFERGKGERERDDGRERERRRGNSFFLSMPRANMSASVPETETGEGGSCIA
jgi:hypothetical protein